ncbi:MAG: hypothetical protein EXR97_04040 [Nitrospiraceae bacterium]|nr:hypothetical protein [Nitrospiraceae bacterium]
MLIDQTELISRRRGWLLHEFLLWKAQRFNTWRMPILFLTNDALAAAHAVEIAPELDQGVANGTSWEIFP